MRRQDTQELITTAELAELVRVHPVTLAEWRRKGIGPAFVQIGPNSIRYRRSDVDEWLEPATQR